MTNRITAGVVAGIAAICVAVPAAGFADKGGKPHSTKPCPTHRHNGRHKGDSKGQKRGFDRGKKCGLQGQTGPTSTTNMTGPTGPTDRDDGPGNHGRDRGRDQH